MRTGGRVALLYVQQPAEFQHWMAVGDLMREEAREEAEGLMQKLSAEVKEWSGSEPTLPSGPNPIHAPTPRGAKAGGVESLD